MRKNIVIIFMLGLVIAPLLMIQTAFAAVDGKWINKNVIEIDGKRYTDLSPGEPNPIFCGPLKSSAPAGATAPTTRAECFSGGRFTLCNDYVSRSTVSSNKETAKLQRQRTAGGSCANDGAAETVNFDKSTIANATSATGEEGEGGATGGDVDPTAPTAPAAEEEKQKSCAELAGVLGWIGCPIVEALDGALNWVDEQIQEILVVENELYKNEDVKTAAGNIRGIAFLILVPIMLVMVIGTALGTSAFDAYSVKKALPRMVVAIIFIALSYYICVFLIELFNVIGRGTLGLFTSPFGDSAGTLSLSDLFGTNADADAHGILGKIILFPVAVGGSIIGLIFVLWLFGGTLFMFAVMALLVMVLRQIFIVALMLVAPLAILAWIFPGNDRLWKSWWSLFSKLLIMFPLIMGVLATGRIFAFILNSPEGVGEGGILNAIMKLAAYMLPYAFIPFTFKFAGGVFATVSGAANDKTKGLFDRQRKKRAENWAGYKTGSKAPLGFRGNNVLARNVRRTGSNLGAGVQGRFGLGRRGAESRANIHQQAVDEALKNPALQSFANNNDHGNAVLGLSGGTDQGAVQASYDLRNGWMANGMSAADAETRRVNALAGARAMGINKTNSGAAAITMMQNKARSVNGGDWQTIQRGIDRMHPDNAVARGAMAGTLQYWGREKGRADLGHTTVEGGMQRAGAHAAVRGYGDGVRAITQNSVTRYQTAMAAGDMGGALDAASEIAGMRNAIGPDVSEENKRHVFDMLSTVGVDVTSPETVAEQLGRLTDPAHHQEITEAIRDRAGIPEPPSDRRLKRNIKRITSLNKGITLYQFQYLWSDQVYVGVMAQDLLKTHPEAVIVANDGFYRVNYSLLGLEMLTLEEWTRQNTVKVK